MNPFTRRQFIKQTAVAGAALAAAPSLHAVGANDKFVVAVMGTNSRGMAHVNALLALPNAEIAYICDVDDKAMAKAVKAVRAKQDKAPQGIKDFRKALDDKAVDAICIATPNHWHAPATILACSAGKHVYVEKPGSHNGREAELMVAAARKNKRVVQMGNQRRSVPWMIELMAKLKAGEIGDVKFARSWYNAARQSIGKGKPAPVPPELDYSLWQGPAPERPYLDNLVHYKWHWRWHWGGGELANNGVHSLDLIRWGLDVDLPTRVTCGGGKWVMPTDDDQETPDTYNVTYDFGNKGATWEGHSCHPRGFEGVGFGVNFYGSKGHLVIAGDAYKTYDLNGKELSSFDGKRTDVDHFKNFLDCIKNSKTPNAEIEEGQKSTLLCHLGNIAWRTGRTINFNPATRQIVGDKEATALWGREYRPGWEPKV